MISIVQIKKDKVKLLKAVRDVVHQKREEYYDTDKKSYRRLRVICQEIDKWIDEMEKKKPKKTNESLPDYT